MSADEPEDSPSVRPGSAVATVLDRITDAFIALDTDWRITYVNDRAAELLERPADDLERSDGRELFTETAGMAFQEEYRHALATQETVSFEEYYPPLDTWFAVRAYPSASGLSIYLSDVTERVERERTIERQRHAMVRLNELHLLVQRVARDVVEAANRSAVAETVCERVTRVEPYDGAWFGWVNPRCGTVETGAWSGGREPGRDGELSYADLSNHLATAIRTGTVRWSAIEETTGAGVGHEALPGEGGGLIAVPLAFEGTVYGVLEIGVERFDRCTEREENILAEFGAVVGHAITAIERKEALMSDRVQVVELASPNAATPFGTLADSDLDLTIERSAPTADGGYLHYVTVLARSHDRLVEFVRADQGFDDVRLIEEHEDGSLFELRTPAVPLVERLAAHGGNVRLLTLDEGVRVVVEFPHTIDVREVFEAVREEYPELELVSQRTREPDRTAGQYRTAFVSRLTDRQRDSLEAAYAAGYFEWPRNRTGEEIADSMGVSPATFHEHIRAAQRKLLVELLE